MEAWKEREKRQDFRSAAIRHTTALSMGVKRKNGSPLKLEDFLPDYCKPKKKPQTDEDIELMLLSFATHDHGQ